MAIKFLCKNELVFLLGYDKCLKCKDKTTCFNYNYELEYQARKKEGNE